MRYLLALLIFFLTTIDVFGWTLSLAPGLSVKNAILYLIMLALAARIVVRGGIRLELPQVHLWFGVLIAYATLTWLAAGLAPPLRVLLPGEQRNRSEVAPAR